MGGGAFLRAFLADITQEHSALNEKLHGQVVRSAHDNLTHSGLILVEHLMARSYRELLITGLGT